MREADADIVGNVHVETIWSCCTFNHFLASLVAVVLSCTRRLCLMNLAGLSFLVCESLGSASLFDGMSDTYLLSLGSHYYLPNIVCRKQSFCDCKSHVFENLAQVYYTAKVASRYYLGFHCYLGL